MEWPKAKIGVKSQTVCIRPAGNSFCCLSPGLNKEFKLVGGWWLTKTDPLNEPQSVEPLVEFGKELLRNVWITSALKQCSSGEPLM